VPEGKVGSYRHPTESREFGLLRVRPEAMMTEKYKHVAVHELIHAIIGPREDPHGVIFQMIADNLGMPEQFQD